MGQCTAVVTVKDPIVPVAKCKNATVNLGTNGNLVLDPALLNNLSSDNCSFTLSAIPATFSCANIGNSTVTMKVTDAGGNTATCTALLTVKDATAPAALCKPATVYLDNTGQGMLTIAQVDNGSNDACGIQSKTLSKTTFNCSEIQTSPWAVFLTVKDVNGNSSACTAMVTIKDAIAPTAICEDVSVNLGPTGKVIVSPSVLAAESFDNCSVWSYSPVAKLYTTANLGPNNLTITIKDWSNNAATCVSVVTVLPYNGNFQGETAIDRSESMAGLAFAIYPNPNAGLAKMAFVLPAEQDYSARITDMTGRLLWYYSGTGLEGENVLPVDLTRIAPGVYGVEFQSAGVQFVKMMVIQSE